MAGLAGKAATLKIGATNYPITRWTYTPTVEALDDSDSLSSGREDYVTGFSSATGTVEGYLDITSTSTNPITAAKPGTAVTILLHINATEKLSIPCLITSFPITSEIKGKITYSFDYQSTGYDMDTDIVTIAS